MYSLVPPVWCHLQTCGEMLQIAETGSFADISIIISVIWNTCCYFFPEYNMMKRSSSRLTYWNVTRLILTDRFLQLWGGIIVDFLFNSWIQASFFQNQCAGLVNVWGALWYADKTWLVCTSGSRIAVFLVCLDPLWDLSSGVHQVAEPSQHVDVHSCSGICEIWFYSP